MEFANFDDERGVSPVIGVVLMVAITVVLAATAATFFLGIGDTGEPKPNTGFSFDYDADSSGDELQISQATGESIPAKELSVVVSGATASSGNPNGEYDVESVSGLGADSEITAGVMITLSDSGLGVSNLDLSDAEVRVVWTAGTGETSSQLQTWEAP